MMKKLYAALTFLVLLLAGLMKIRFDTHDFKVKKVVFNSAKIPPRSRFTMLQMSDIHDHVFGRDNEQLINTVQQANADIIVLTGDLIDKSTVWFNHVYSLVERLTAINQHVYFVCGNHEWENGMTAQFLKGLRERGITLLDNENTSVIHEKATITLAGVNDSSTEHDNVTETFKNISNHNYTVLLSHAPGVIMKDEPIPADLILSGHTHGGQIRFPLIGALIAPGQGYFPKYDKGTYKLSSNRHLYIDSGVGTTRLPIRFLNKSQISLITIENTSAQ
ncbi:hypothetical protein SAMN05216238_11616 [Lentibacillus persicus]|uniref:Calcineurin-like phosphoesterase domain-containing protein n=1 Tax=Lentibacillus persicus TaxID=640948 RepID=A0A1I2AJH8_9BACI|nr:metallophosphoesterase [Lentibacillus persicus]SFE43708.1 hypothetical protein SAMN05216238_11616 [Lentibacillus persicus]